VDVAGVAFVGVDVHGEADDLVVVPQKRMAKATPAGRCLERRNLWR